MTRAVQNETEMIYWMDELHIRKSLLPNTDIQGEFYRKNRSAWNSVVADPRLVP